MTVLDDGRPAGSSWHSGFGGFVLREWPYLLMLLLALFGVAYTSYSQTSIYWVILAPLIGLVCIVSRWGEARRSEQHVYLVVSQVLHWGAVLLAMQLMSLQVTRQLSGLAAALGVLTLLALGTFTAGLHIRAWKIAVVGLILGASVPAIALLQQTALLILLVLAVLAAVVIPFFWTRSREPADALDRPYEPRRPHPAASERPVPQPPLYETPPVSAPFPVPPPVTPAAPAGSLVAEPAPEDPDQPPAADNVRNISGAR